MKNELKKIVTVLVLCTVSVLSIMLSGCKVKDNIDELRAENSQSSSPVEGESAEDDIGEDFIKLQSEFSNLYSRLNLITQDLSVLGFELDELAEREKNGEILHKADIVDLNIKIAEQVNDLNILIEEVEYLSNYSTALMCDLIEEENARINACKQIREEIEDLSNYCTALMCDLVEEEYARIKVCKQLEDKIISLSGEVSNLKDVLSVRLNDYSKRIEQLEQINARAGYGWEYVEGYTNVDFSVTNENITHSGYTSAVKYVSKTDSDSYMVIADIYVTGTETVSSDAVKLSLATVAYEWRSGYLPLIFALPSELRSFGNTCPYVEVETYSWLLDATTNIGKLNGNGSITYSLASTRDDGINYYHYVQGIAMELDTYNDDDLTIPGKHIIVRMYNNI